MGSRNSQEIREGDSRDRPGCNATAQAVPVGRPCRPYGEAIGTGVNGRGSEYALLGEKLRFTGQVRDGETGLDYFGARYYGSAHGRFLGVDPGNAAGRVEDPQSWNGYAYVRNSPLTLVDPDGEDYQVCVGSCSSVPEADWPSFTTYLAQQNIQRRGDDEGGVFLTRDGTQLLSLGSYRRFYNQDAARFASVVDGTRMAGPTVRALGLVLLAAGGVATGVVAWEAVTGGGLMAVGIAGSEGVSTPTGQRALSETGRAAAQVWRFADHVLERMAPGGRESHVTRKMALKVIEKGRLYSDPKNKSFVYVLKGGMASGETIAVAVNPAARTITTIMTGRAKDVIRPRFVPLN